MAKYNVLYYDEHGQPKTYLSTFATSLKQAEHWRDQFNQRYRKPYPNGKGYYASAKIIRMPE